jgi:MOSC domain-containing protein YiiM
MNLMNADIKATVCSAWSRPASSELDRSIVHHRERVTGRTEMTTGGFASDLAWHTTERSKLQPNPMERAVLIQTTQHYADLRSQFQELPFEEGGQSQRFGENLIVDGFNADQVCVGDVFQVEGSPLLLQVTMPRLACMRPDKRNPVGNGARSGEPGTVRHWASATGRAGLFCKVLAPGPIGEGDVLQLKYRSRPKWNLALLSSLCYASSPLQINWAGTRDELVELSEMDELGSYEWKERLWVHLEKIVNEEGKSGDGTLPNVGIKMEGSFHCVHCNQKFLTERALEIHCSFAHDYEH